MEEETSGSKGKCLEVAFNGMSRKQWRNLHGTTSEFLVNLKTRSAAQIKKGKWGDFEFFGMEKVGSSHCGNHN